MHNITVKNDDDADVSVIIDLSWVKFVVLSDCNKNNIHGWIGINERYNKPNASITE